jgi:tetratricopeptide (TPR) repeat protein
MLRWLTRTRNRSAERDTSQVDVIACRKRGNNFLAAGRIAEAEACYREALALGPDGSHGVDTHIALAYVLIEQRRLQEAQSHLRAALDIDPCHIDACYLLGTTLEACGESAAAIEQFCQTLALSPDFDAALAALNNLGGVLLEQGQSEQAIECFHRALKIRPQSADLHHNLGMALQDASQPGASLEHYRRATELNPDFAVAHWMEALCHLQMGDFEEGWKKYEWRWKKEPLQSWAPRFTQPRWDGSQSLHGKTILLWAEQGLGDTIQFCRYVNMVAARGAIVTLASQTPLKSLLAQMSGIRHIVTDYKSLPACDFHCPLISLPLAFGTRLDTIPADVPYLRADPAKRQRWHERLDRHKGLRVGLVWAGGLRPEQPELASTNERRNIPLKKLAPLNAHGVEFFSLQIGDYGARQLKDLQQISWNGPQIIDYTDTIADFSDTAALIDNLDLVISVDTSTAHLAGALGKPVWIMNRFDTCWRWMRNRTDSPWYPTARLFRQPHPGDWDSVVEQVVAALSEVAQFGVHTESTHVQLD